LRSARHRSAGAAREGAPRPIDRLQSSAKLLGDRFSLGWTGRRTAAPRQHTLQATLDWSYDLLSDAERRTFERLSVFPGPFALDAALAVVADESLDVEAAAAALDGLTAKSLVCPDRRGETSGYRLPEMTRTYGKSRLLARGETDFLAVARRHAHHLLQGSEALA
jgi:predicted ATPase